MRRRFPAAVTTKTLACSDPAKDSPIENAAVMASPRGPASAGQLFAQHMTKYVTKLVGKLAPITATDRYDNPRRARRLGRDRQDKLPAPSRS
jgi:hypothetical protein